MSRSTILDLTRFRGHPGRGEYGCHGATEAIKVVPKADELITELAEFCRLCDDADQGEFCRDEIETLMFQLKETLTASGES